MTKKQLKEKFEELKIKTNEFLDEYLEKAINSGAIDIFAYDNNFKLPKVIMTAACLEVTEQWRPHDDKLRSEIENLRYFV